MRDTTKELELEQLPGISELTVFDRFKNAEGRRDSVADLSRDVSHYNSFCVSGRIARQHVGRFRGHLKFGLAFGEGSAASIPGLKNFGGSAILSLMVPSIMVFMNVFNQNTLDAANMLMREANFLYFYNACLVCGSIMGMHRKILVQGLIRMIIPMAVAMIAALIVGTSVGTLLGLGFEHTLFYIVTPNIAGGIGEGISAVIIRLQRHHRYPEWGIGWSTDSSNHHRKLLRDHLLRYFESPRRKIS